PIRAQSEAAARVSPSCSVVGRNHPVKPTPLAPGAESYVGLNLDPVSARGEHRLSGQVYRKGGAALHARFVQRAVNSRAGNAGIVSVKEDIPIAGRSRTIKVPPISVDRLHIPSLTSWHDEVISKIRVMWRRVGKFCRQRGIGSSIVILIVKDLRIRRTRAVSPAGVQTVISTAQPAPDSEFAAGPYCCVRSSGIWRIDGTGGCPTVGCGVVSPPRVEIPDGAIESAPDDHLAAGPNCGVFLSGIWRIDGAGGCPTIGGGIISAAGVYR